MKTSTLLGIAALGGLLYYLYTQSRAAAATPVIVANAATLPLAAQDAQFNAALAAATLNPQLLREQNY